MSKAKTIGCIILSIASLMLFGEAAFWLAMLIIAFYLVLKN